MHLQDRIEELVEQINILTEECYPQFNLKVGYLTFFSQNQDDYNKLTEELKSLGSLNEANNGVKFILNETMEVLDEHIEVIRVRKPDIHRKELGCCDLIYNDKDYSVLREIALDKGFDVILRNGYEMIELSTFDINVYAYLVKDL